MDVPGAGCTLPISGGLALSPGSIAERHPAKTRRVKKKRATRRSGESVTSSGGAPLMRRRVLSKSCETRKRMSIFDHRSQGNEITRVGQAAQRAEHVSSFQTLDGVAHGDGEMEHHAGIAIAVGNASGAAIAHRRRLRKIPHRADTLGPGITAPH